MSCCPSHHTYEDLSYHLLYHSPIQIAAGYAIGLIAGGTHFTITEYLPLYHPESGIGQAHKMIEDLWVGLGGIGGWDLGGADGGWGEGRFLLGDEDIRGSSGVGVRSKKLR